MERRQLAALFVCNLGLYLVGYLHVTLLPVYAVQLGMSESSVGIYLGVSFASLTSGSLASGWLSDRFQKRRETMMTMCCLGIPATFLMGQANHPLLLTLATMGAWFSWGIGVSLVSILTGMYAEAAQRGRVFGLIATTLALAQVVGGFTSGAIVDRWGFAALFSLTALVWLIPLSAALFIRDSRSSRSPGQEVKPAASLSRSLWLLIIANTLVSVTVLSANMSRPLTMNRLGFDASAIASATSLSGLVALPLPFLVGWLSDRIGRRQLLIVGYVMTSLAMLLLIASFDLWQFLLSACLFTLGGGTLGVANALVTDLSPPEALGKALSRFSATPSFAGIVGFSVMGMVIEALGMPGLLLIAAALPALSILMLLTIRKRAQVAPT